MKRIRIKLAAGALATILLSLCGRAGPLTLEDVSPHLPSDAQIIWKAPANGLPKLLWTYRKEPQIFSAVTVSNAAVLGAFKLSSLPKSFSKPVTIWEKMIEGDPQPDYFSLEPSNGSLAFRRERRHVVEGDNTSDALARRTWQYAAKLGLEKALLVQGNATDNSTVCLSRKVDGIVFKDDLEGFSVRYGTHGEILNLFLTWPKLERVAQERVITIDEIMRCIRSFKTPVLPGNDEADYFARVKAFSSVKTFTIINITPYYSEGKYGVQPSDKEPERFVGPVAVLDAVADWGKTKAQVKLFCPLIASDTNRILAKKKAQQPSHSGNQ